MQRDGRGGRKGARHRVYATTRVMGCGGARDRVVPRNGRGYNFRSTYWPRAWGRPSLGGEWVKVPGLLGGWELLEAVRALLA